MSENWIQENIEKLSIEELQELDGKMKRRGFSAIFGFIVGMFPQYTLLTHPMIRNYKETGFKGRIGIIVLLPVPFLFAYVISRPFSNSYDEYFKSLQEKYK